MDLSRYTPLLKLRAKPQKKKKKGDNKIPFKDGFVKKQGSWTYLLKNSRFHAFQALNEYKLVRGGLVIPKDKSPNDLELTEKHLWHYMHKDENASRKDPRTPKYMALLSWELLGDEIKIIPHMAHLASIYQACGRNEISRCNEVISPGIPYWCDLYSVHKNRKRRRSSPEQCKPRLKI